MATMEWHKLLSQKRLGRTAASGIQAPRTEFSADFDRIIFSSAFRRLQDKTQVFPLAKSDYVRTRLTHSLEVSSVGRSLGMIVGQEVLNRDQALAKTISAHDIGTIVATACLAHDIGNPPFGHAGESAIQEWFGQNPSAVGWPIEGDIAQKEDLLRFEGNAFGFRTLAHLQNPQQPGGLQLTAATLGAFSKYPRPSKIVTPKLGGISAKKFGFMQAEASLFGEVAETLGLLEKPTRGDGWVRHPLAFLVEAADDICYRLMDVEDGFKTRHLEYEELSNLYEPWMNDRSRSRLDEIPDQSRKAEWLRATTIGSLVEASAAVFLANHDALLAGTFDEELIGKIDRAKELEAFKELGRKKVYVAPPVIEVEACGFEVIGGLLAAFLGAIEDSALAKDKRKRPIRSRTLLGLFPTGETPFAKLDWYQRALLATDFVAGMTDSYAVQLYQTVAGIKV